MATPAPAMKITFLLIYNLFIANYPGYAQEVKGFHPNVSFSATPSLHPATIAIPCSDFKADLQSKSPLPFFHTSRTPQINGLALLTRGSIMGWLGFRGKDNDRKSLAASTTLSNRQTNAGNKRALTGLAMMAGSIPYFFQAMKNIQKAGFKLVCQKTSTGTNNRASRKVPGVTYAIQIGQ